MRIPRILAIFVIMGLGFSPATVSLAAPHNSTIGHQLIQQHNWPDLTSYAQWIDQNVDYRRDQGALDWARPETTLQRGYGDCKDYAMLNRAVLTAMGFEVKVYTVQFSDQSLHAICIFKVKGYYALMSNSEFEISSAKTWEDFQDYLLLNRGYFCPMVVP